MPQRRLSHRKSFLGLSHLSIFRRSPRRLAARTKLSGEQLESRLMLHGEGEPEYDPTESFHIHADLRILINGQELVIPQGVGDSLGADLHTHDNSGRLHIHPHTPPGRFITLGDWFDTWRADTTLGDPNAFLSSTQLMNNVVDSTHVLKMYVNGEESTDFDDYEIHDEDDITLAYTSNPIVNFQTNVGIIPIELLANETPRTFANFRSYFAQYPGTIFHRAAESPPGTEFVVQGGGFAPTNLKTTDLSVIQASRITTRTPIQDEPNRSNTRATVSMAKNSLGATSEWFVNMNNNSFLDAQGFGVFGLVLDMTVPDMIAALPTQDLDPAVPNSVFDYVPYTSSGDIAAIQAVTGDGFVRGASFNDTNGNGTRESGESGISGVTVFVDANQNGQLDVNETRTTTAADGTYTFRLAPGSYQIRAVAQSPLSQTNGGPQSVTVTVAGDATANFGFSKLAVNDSFTVAEDSNPTNNAANRFDVLANDVNAQSTTITGVSNFSAGGSATIVSGLVHYTPAANFFGTETFRYTINNGQGVTDSATVTVTVTSVNDPPTAGDDSFDVVKGVAKSLNVLTNDSILPDTNETLTITLGSTTTANGGSLALSGDGRQVIYTPAASFVGNDSFTYTISDGNGGTDQATVSLHILDFVPRAIRGQLEQNGNGPVAIGGMPIILTGTDQLGNQVQQTTVTQPDGTYEFPNLAPGNYEVEKPAAPFLNSTAAKLQVDSPAQSGDSTGNSFEQSGRRSEFIDIRDFLGSTPRHYVLAAVAPGATQSWYALGDGWSGAANVSVQLASDRSNVVITVDDGEQKSALVSTMNGQGVEFLGEENGSTLIRVRGDLSSLPFQPVTAAAMNNSLGQPEGESSSIDISDWFLPSERSAADWRLAFDAAFADDDLLGGM